MVLFNLCYAYDNSFRYYSFHVSPLVSLDYICLSAISVSICLQSSFILSDIALYSVYAVTTSTSFSNEGRIRYFVSRSYFLIVLPNWTFMWLKSCSITVPTPSFLEFTSTLSNKNTYLARILSSTILYILTNYLFEVSPILVFL